MYEHKNTGSNAGHDIIELPDRADTQTTTVFHRTSSLSQSNDEPSMEYIQQRKEQQRKEQAVRDIVTPCPQIKIKPIEHDNKRRPVSRAKFYASMPKIYEDNFLLPTKENLSAKYRQASNQPLERYMNATSKVPVADVFVKLDNLHVRDCFGLNTLKYVMEADDDIFQLDGNENPPILSLVSCGSEVIMLSKKIFLKYADHLCKMTVRDSINVYPTEEILQDNMQTEVDWGCYREKVLKQ